MDSHSCKMRQCCFLENGFALMSVCFLSFHHEKKCAYFFDPQMNVTHNFQTITFHHLYYCMICVLWILHSTSVISFQMFSGSCKKNKLWLQVRISEYETFQRCWQTDSVQYISNVMTRTCGPDSTLAHGQRIKRIHTMFKLLKTKCHMLVHVKNQQ